MTSSDFSTGNEPQLHFKFEGWPQTTKDVMINRARNIAGVRDVRAAGGASGAYVYYDPRSGDPTHIQSELRKLATELMPGHAWP